MQCLPVPAMQPPVVFEASARQPSFCTSQNDGLFKTAAGQQATAQMM